MVSTSEQWINEAKRLNYNVYLGKIQNYKPLPDTPNVYYISAGCSLTFMDNEIDTIYSKIMFRGIGIENRIKESVKKLNFVSKLNRSYLPIGLAVCTETDTYTKNCKGKCYIVSSPCAVQRS